MSGSIADYYETYWSEEGFNPRDIEWNFGPDLFASAILTNSICLDVGCGDASTAGPWLRHHDCRYVGVDISRNALRDARARGYAVCQIADGAALPFPADTFDAAVCVEVLEHAFQPQLIAGEVLRVLKPGGVFVATAPNIAYWRKRLDMLLLGRWNPSGDDLTEQTWRSPHIRFFTVPSLGLMLRSVGFEQVAIGAHDGGLMRDIPRVRGQRLLWSGRASPAYRWLEQRVPSLFGARLHVIARKPNAADH